MDYVAALGLWDFGTSKPVPRVGVDTCWSERMSNRSSEASRTTNDSRGGIRLILYGVTWSKGRTR